LAPPIYLYDGDNSIEEMDNGGNVVARYARTKTLDEPLSELRSGATSYYQQDGLGSVTSLSNSAGAVAETYTYDSYGKLTASTGTLVNPFQYTGREFDSETTLLFNRARYFDPSAGRFLSQDPIRYRGGVNFYAYTRNNPVVRTDPFGYLGGCSAEQAAQSPNTCAGPTDPNSPYQGPDGSWNNVPDPTPSVPDDGPTPSPNPPDPNKKCDQPQDPPPPVPKPPDPIPLVPSSGSCTDAVGEFGAGVGGAAIMGGGVALLVFTDTEWLVGIEGGLNVVHLSPAILGAPLTLMGHGALETMQNCFGW
jgi:RHS repeat-associated protein